MTFKIVISENIQYVSARLAAASLRPLTFLMLGKVLANGELALYAVFLLIISLGVLLSGADAHRSYYDRYFRRHPNLALAFVDYMAKMIFFGFFGVIATVIAGIVYSAPAWLIGLAAIGFLIEKGFDEILRFFLFEQNFSKWSRIVLVRVCINHISIATSMIAHFWLGSTVTLNFFLSVITLSSALSLAFAWRQTGRVSSILVGNTKFLICRFKRCLKEAHLMIWDLVRVSSLATVNYLDRVIVGFVDVSVLPAMTLLSMCFGFIQQFVDMFFTSRVRGDLLRGSISLNSIFLNRTIWLSVFAGLVAGFVAIYASIFFVGSKFEFTASYIFFYVLLHVTLALTAICQQMVYWGSGLQRAFVTEMLFIGLLSILIGYFLYARSGLSWPLCALAVAVVVRGVIYAAQAYQREKL